MLDENIYFMEDCFLMQYGVGSMRDAAILYVYELEPQKILLKVNRFNLS